MRNYFLLALVAIALSGCIETAYRTGNFLVDATALQPWKKLALDGDVEAQYKVGTMYCCGERPDHDNVKALYWFCQAAKQGQRDAQYKVGELYETAAEYPGNIIPTSPTIAYTYYTLAEKNGQPDAKKALDRLTPTLTLSDLQEAEGLLADFPKIACEVAR